MTVRTRIEQANYIYFNTSDPGSSNGSNAGYVVGARWINTSSKKEFVCVDNTSNNAVWTETTQTGGSGDVVGPGSSTDGAAVIFDGTTGKLVKNSTLIVEPDGDTTVNGDLTITGDLIVSGLASVSGTGDVIGPSSATDNTIALFSGSSGKRIKGGSATISNDGAISIIAADGTSQISHTLHDPDVFGLFITEDLGSVGAPVPLSPLAGFFLALPSNGVGVIGATNEEMKSMLTFFPAVLGGMGITLSIDNADGDADTNNYINVDETKVQLSASISGTVDYGHIIRLTEDTILLQTVNDAGDITLRSSRDTTISGTGDVDIKSSSGEITVHQTSTDDSGGLISINVDGGLGAIFTAISRQDNDLPSFGFLVDNIGMIDLGTLVDRAHPVGGGSGGDEGEDGDGATVVDGASDPTVITTVGGTEDYGLALLGLDFGGPFIRSAYFYPATITTAAELASTIMVDVSWILYMSTDSNFTNSPGAVFVANGATSNYTWNTSPILGSTVGAISASPTDPTLNWNGSNFEATYVDFVSGPDTYEYTMGQSGALQDSYFFLGANQGGGGGGSTPVDMIGPVSAVMSPPGGNSILAVQQSGTVRAAIGTWWDNTTADHGLHIVSAGFKRGYSHFHGYAFDTEHDETALLVPESGSVYVGGAGSVSTVIVGSSFEDDTNGNIPHGLHIFGMPDSGVPETKIITPEEGTTYIHQGAVASGTYNHDIIFYPEGSGPTGLSTIGPAIYTSVEKGTSHPRDWSVSSLMSSGTHRISTISSSTHTTFVSASNDGIGDFHAYVHVDNNTNAMSALFMMSEDEANPGHCAVTMGIDFSGGMPSNAIQIAATGIMFIGLITDLDAVPSVDTNGRILLAGDNSSSVDWANRSLSDGVTGAQLSWSASGVKLDKLTANTVPYLNASKIFTSSAVTDTELGYVQGVTSALQTQLDGMVKLAGRSGGQSIIGGTASGNDLTLTSTSNPTLGRIVMASHTNFQSYVPYFTEHDNGSSGTTKTFDWNNGIKQKITMTASCSGTFTAPPGPCNLTLFIVQSGTGSYTMTWPSSVKWAGGSAPTLSTAVGAVDIIGFYYNGTYYYGDKSLNFS